MSKHTEREVFSYCGETCPAVDRAFSDALDALKEFLSADDASDVESVLYNLCKKVKEVGTDKLRDALRDAVSDKISAESERDDYKRQASDLESQVSSLESEIVDLSRQLDEVTA
jgi:hypothetical protein